MASFNLPNIFRVYFIFFLNFQYLEFLLYNYSKMQNKTNPKKIILQVQF